jgi:hypothetical protein
MVVDLGVVILLVPLEESGGLVGVGLDRILSMRVLSEVLEHPMRDTLVETQL